MVQLIVALIIVLIIALLTVDPEFDHIWKYVSVHCLVQGSQGVVAQVQCQIGNNSWNDENKLSSVFTTNADFHL